MTATIRTAAIAGPIIATEPNGGNQRRHATAKPRMDRLVRTNESDVRSDCNPLSGGLIALLPEGLIASDGSTVVKLVHNLDHEDGRTDHQNDPYYRRHERHRQ